MDILSRQTEQTPAQALTTPSEVNKIIKNLKNGKAPVDDAIFTPMLKNLPKKMQVQLHYIYNACIRLHHFPFLWKNATIIPVLKSRKPKS